MMLCDVCGVVCDVGWMSYVRCVCMGDMWAILRNVWNTV